MAHINPQTFYIMAEALANTGMPVDNQQLVAQTLVNMNGVSNNTIANIDRLVQLLGNVRAGQTIIRAPCLLTSDWQFMTDYWLEALGGDDDAVHALFLEHPVAFAYNAEGISAIDHTELLVDNHFGHLLAPFFQTPAFHAAAAGLPYGYFHVVQV
ncbi:hypothetical protein TeGR_g14992 [Tetraparma gracilis]|uniref:Uncharacterized protein n=1 Tax=Tetraparma gracilis TaxID=2962635 RepID=A0ABQ6N859_9STRA|nr:hypothetical protein TeGR_g14992 [Tetraparma gracilis]